MKNIDEMTTRELVEALLNDTEIQDVMEERIICEDIAGQTHKERSIRGGSETPRGRA